MKQYQEPDFELIRLQASVITSSGMTAGNNEGSIGNIDGNTEITDSDDLDNP